MSRGIGGDLRLAARQLRSSPVVTLVAIASLALGIGVSTAIFSTLNAMALRPLPVAHPEQLVTISSNTALGMGFQGGSGWSYSMWERLRDRSGVFDGAFAWMLQRLEITSGQAAQPVDVLFASGELFATLGVPAAIGRTFTRDDDRTGGGSEGPVAVLSHEFWQRNFGGSVDAIGTVLAIDGAAVTLVGVAAPPFSGLDVGQRFDIAVPLAVEGLVRGPRAVVDNPRMLVLNVMLRLRDGQTAADATAALRTMQAEIVGPEAPAFVKQPFVAVAAATGISDRTGLRQRFQRPLFVLAIVSGLVLLVVCMNIANVLLARGAARRHELSVRVALGASRWRLARLLLTEGAIVAAAGGLAGLWLAWWASRLLVAELPIGDSPIALDAPIDWRVMTFATLVTVAAVALFAIVPAVSASHVAPAEALAESSRIAGSRGALAGALIVAQVAVAMVLITAASLLVATVVGLARLPLGFNPEGLLVATVNTARAAVDPAARLTFSQQIVDELGAVPGVIRVAASQWTPFAGGGGLLSDARGRRADVSPQAAFNFVTPGWFATYETPLVAGRDFASSDAADAPRVAIVNETLARTLFGNRTPLGETLQSGPCGRDACLVIGVAADASYGRSLRDAPPPTIYVPLAQAGELLPPGSQSLRVTMRTAGEPGVVAAAVSSRLRSLDPALSATLRPLRAYVEASFAQERLAAVLAAALAIVALLLSALGLYGTVACALARRRTEVGVRLALGASGARVVWGMMARVLLLVAAGTVAGLVAGQWLSRFVAPLLFGVEPGDPATLVVAVGVLLATALLAAWIPASRAARIDPAAALRQS